MVAFFDKVAQIVRPLERTAVQLYGNPCPGNAQHLERWENQQNVALYLLFICLLID